MAKRKKIINPHAKNILVLGGYGFIGRAVVRYLRGLGHNVSIGSRRANCNTHDHVVTLPFHQARSHRELTGLINGADVVINAVGILRQRFGETYEAVHHRFVADLARVCATEDIRLVHISALGLDNDVTSRFLTSKRFGEAAIKRSQADWFIVRPSLIDGDDGYGAKWFRRVAALPIHLIPANAKGVLSPIHIEDLAEAIGKIALQPPKPNANREYDLGGDRRVTLFDYLRMLRGRPPLWRCRVPAFLVRVASHVLDLLHITPLSFGHYELLKADNCAYKNRLPELLQRPTMPLGLVRGDEVAGELSYV